MVHKTKEEAKANFEAATGYIPERWLAGVKKADWATPAGSPAAEKNFNASMSKALADKSRQKGVKKISNTEWQDAAEKKGFPIIGGRISDALDKWLANWGPMYDKVISTVAGLPARTTDFMTNINKRLVPTVKAWKEAAGKA